MPVNQNIVNEVFVYIDLYLFWYPIVMSARWILGSVIGYFKEEFNTGKISDPPILDDPPAVTIMIPLYNEEKLCRRTVETALQVDYPNLTIIAVNDCSKDNTADILDEIDPLHDNLIVIHQEVNQGKASGLIAAAERSNDEYLICIDGDTVIDPFAVHWMIRHFVNNPKIGAVTGNPRISNRNNTISRIQVGEYSTMFGMIKRTQNLTGSLYTLSGVIAGYRKKAIKEIGYWTHDAMTEDIDVSWKMQRAGWILKFEPHSLVWCLQPESLIGLWKQRTRWGVGGAQVFCKNLDILMKPVYFRLWPLYIEMVLSYAWCYLLIISTFTELFLLNSEYPINIGLLEKPLILTFVCMFQVLIGTLIDAKYDRGLYGNYSYMVLYPICFWLIGFFAAAYSFPNLIFSKTAKFATWDASDRGNSDSEEGSAPHRRSFSSDSSQSRESNVDSTCLISGSKSDPEQGSPRPRENLDENRTVADESTSLLGDVKPIASTTFNV